MPQSLTGRLNDEEFCKKIAKLARDYATNARVNVDYYAADFDAAHDALMCYANLTKQDIVKLSKGNPRRFVLPMTATQIHTLTTFLAQVLYGDDNPNKVEPGGPDDEGAARSMNELLKWNAEMQVAGMYQLGFMWIENTLTYNRGIFYESFAPINKSVWQDVPDTDEDGNPVLDDAGAPKTSAKKIKTRLGGYNRLDIVSPYDFYMDPLMPIFRMQEGRYAGHRMNKPWNELKNRSLLDPADPMYLSPAGIANLKKKPSKGFVYPDQQSTAGGMGRELMSRTAYERAKVQTPVDSRIDSKDPGVVDFLELWVRLIPKDYEIDDRPDPEVFQIILGNEKEVLALNESTYEHGMFPYSIGEARPSPFYQFSPSWVMILNSLQNYVDYLKNRHQEAVTRTIGNIFIAKSNLIDISDFEDPEKEGKFITILPEGQNMPINEIVKQVPMVDMTANFLGEMKGFISFAEATSGANQNLQGQTGAPGVTATEFSGTQQMAAGRLTAIARLLSVSALVPQTKRFVSNFQQFYDGSLYRKIEGLDPNTLDEFSDGPTTITNDVIQGTFTFRAHDGALPGPDARKVAALTRIVESAQTAPQLFTPGEGNIDLRRVYLDLARAAGGKPETYRWRLQDIQKVQAQEQAAQQAAQNAPKPVPPIKPAMSITAKIEQLTPAERFQIMADIGVNESGAGGPMPPGTLPPHPGGPALPPGAVPPPRPSHMAPRPTHAPAPGAKAPHPGPKPGLATALRNASTVSLPSAAPPAVRPANI